MSSGIFVTEKSELELWRTKVFAVSPLRSRLLFPAGIRGTPGAKRNRCITRVTPERDPTASQRVRSAPPRESVAFNLSRDRLSAARCLLA